MLHSIFKALHSVFSTAVFCNYHTISIDFLQPCESRGKWNSEWLATCMRASRGSPAPTHVQQTTSALCSRSRSHCFFKARYRFSSDTDSSPVSSFSCCSFCSSAAPAAPRICWCSARNATGESMASRLLAHRRTTRRPVR